LLKALCLPLLQVLSWPDSDAAPNKNKSNDTDSRNWYNRYSNTSTEAFKSSRPKLMLELQDDSEQTAAIAVLKALYVTQPLPELLFDSTQEQQLQAALLADKWQVPSVSTEAMLQLLDALSSNSGLTTAVKQRIITGPALPGCMKTLMKSVLLAELGDLQAAWADLASNCLVELKQAVACMPSTSCHQLLNRVLPRDAWHL
jgi:hypothetical protein